jgi:hypothetical protein
MESAPAYQNALDHSNFSHDVNYTQHAPQQPRRNRQRNIIWFNPPFSMNVSTNIGRNFLNLIDNHFPSHHKLHKIFNRNTVKVSYSCMSNVKSIITKHNAHKARKNKTQGKGTVNCSCSKNAMKKDIVYKATVTTSNPNTIMNYIGMTSTTFKERLANHNYTFEHKEHSNKTELSKYIWTLKDNKKDFNINWQILKRAISYTGGSKRCNLCLEEKCCILKENQNCLLNKRMEIISTCRHRKKFRVNNANNTLPQFD